MRIAVCAKQVPDPDIPPSQFKLSSSGRAVEPPRNVSPVINGFDLNAVEAAVRIKESADSDTEITVISVGHGFALDVMKRALATGADRLVLVDDPSAQDLDAAGTAQVLAATLSMHGPFDLVLCGRQASDWDQAHVPLFVAELMDIPCVTVARRIDIDGASATVERVVPDGYQVVEVALPALVTVSNELGEPRYPALKGIMAASRKQPEVHKLDELGLTDEQIAPMVELISLEIPQRQGRAEMIDGADDAEKGRNLAIRLRHERLI
ncbi:MAG: electron transfer flavoprotein subunit beta/FixA family protein [Chloroflexi bacterium]|nr:electron transfer flavoprotein subunit beta/FixA family protein [Chloroflexota bacterium]